MILVFASFVVPICALAFGTASIGGDREDKTLVFLLVRPIPRALVLLAKFTATLPLVLGLVLGSYWLYCRLAGEIGRVAFPLYLPAMIYMTLAYICLFHLFAVSFRHSTIIALDLRAVHGAATGKSAGHRQARGGQLLRALADVRRRAQKMRSPDENWFEPLSPEVAGWAVAGIAVFGLILALVVFSRREYRDLT